MVQTGNINNDWSEYSNSIIIRPIATPTLLITNIGNGEVNAQSYIFKGIVEGLIGEIIESYSFNLYNQNGLIISAGETKLDRLLTHQFNNLQDNNYYYVDFQIKTVNGLEVKSQKYQFLAKYPQPFINDVIILENLPDQGSVQVSSQIIRLRFEVGDGNILFEEDEWINLHDGMIYIQDGFLLSQDFTIRMWIKNIKDNSPFLKMYSNQGIIEFKRRDIGNDISKIYAYKKAYTYEKTYMVFSNEINYFSDSEIFIYFQQKNNQLYVQAEVIN